MWDARVAAGMIFAVSSLSSSPVSAFAIFTVGGDAACQFTSIQAAVSAAAANPGEDYVWIARNQTYTGQHIVVQDQDVLIEGGFVDCNDFDIDTELTTVSGSGNGGAAVFAIRGTSNVLLTNLLIRGADRSGDGGGIDFAGPGNLTLQQSTVSLNTAGYGGGINFRGTGGPATLVIGHDTLVLNNTATTSGGGIRIEGNARLQLSAPNTLIAYNHALNGYGGGVEVIGPAFGSIGSPGYNGGAVIQFNDAQRGGGVSVNAGPNPGDFAYLHLFTTDPQHPVQVTNNIASLTGGGIYVQPNSSFDISGFHPIGAAVCAQQFRIDDNIAQGGAAIHSDTESFNGGFDDIGGSTFLYTDIDGCSAIPNSPAAVACATGVECNTMDRNVNEDGTGQPTQGATILAQKKSFLRIYGLRMRDNVGAHALHLFDTDADMRNALVVNNAYSADLFLVDTDGDNGLVVRGTTIANNVIGGSVLRTGNDSQIGNAIISQPGVPAYSGDGFPQSSFDYIVASNTAGLPVRSDISQANAVFVDVDVRNYHLALGSPGMDFAPAAGSFDLDGNPRDVDLAAVPNAFGPRDIGAFETQRGCIARADTIFCDGFDG
jgi:predicted outer membrane repeat protein